MSTSTRTLHRQYGGKGDKAAARMAKDLGISKGEAKRRMAGKPAQQPGLVAADSSEVVS